MSKVNTEQMSATLIPEAINIDASINTNSESKIVILSQELEKASLKTNTEFMQSTWQNSTFMNEEVMAHHREESIDDLYYCADTSREVSEMMGELGEWPTTKGKGFDYMPLEQVLAKLGIPLQQAYDTLQVFDLRDFKGKWSDPMTRFGFVFNHEYEGDVPGGHQKIWFTPDVVSPHGHEFFIEFFKLTKDWFL